MKSFRALLTIAAVGVFASLGACGNQAPAGESSTTTNSVASASNPITTTTPTERPRFDHGPRMRGPAFLLFAALREPLNLTADQEATIKQAAEALRPQAAKPHGPDRAEHRAALAAAVRAGTVDVTAFGAPEISKRAEHEAALAKALATLHATLTKEQRAALVAAVEKRGEGFEHGPMGGPKGHGKHGPKAGPKGHGKHGRGFGPMHMIEGLDLTQAQKDAIVSKLEARKPPAFAKPDREAMKARHEAMRQETKTRLRSFAADTFDATAFVARPADAPAKLKGAPHGHMLGDLAVIVPLLTPAQREALAAKIEKGPKDAAAE